MGNSKLPVVTLRFVVLAFALSIVVLVLPVDSLWGSLLIVNGALVFVAAIDWLRTPAPSRVEIERSVPAVIAMRGDGEIEWTVTNPVKRSLHVSIADELPPSLQAATRRVSIHLPARGRITAHTPILPARRGRFTIALLTVRTLGPFGLVGRQGVRTDPSVMRVYPPFDSRREAELRIERAQLLEVGMRSVRSRGGGTEFEQLREYSVDDDYRRIDWAATARAGKPIVRTYRAEQNQNVMLLVDCGRVMAGRVGDVTRLEHAIDAVLAVSTVATRLGDRVGVVAFDDRIRSEVGLAHGASHVARVTETVYDLQPRLVESDYRSAFVAMMSRSQRRSLVIVLTEPAEQATDETLLPVLPMIAQRHLVVVASVSDPDVNEWARLVPTETDKAYRKASAIGALRDRHRTAASLRARGATVIDAAPGKLAPAVADAYMEAKASARL